MECSWTNPETSFYTLQLSFISKFHFPNPFNTYITLESKQWFPPHMDASFVDSEKKISHYTVLFYLNDCEGNGELSFMERSHPYSEELTTLCNIKPITGSVLIFPHQTLHTSSELKAKQNKFLIRNDLLYSLSHTETKLQ